MAIPKFLEQLLTARGPSGHETGPAGVWREACAAFADEVGGDLVGSSFARVRGTADGPTLAIVGHIDEIGLHVSHIDDDGYVRFGQVGGWDPIVLVGQRVTLSTRNGPVSGVIARKPIHLLEDEE
ncbi:MAG: M42 family peptidase, partial [Solirubrobacterales bacterium]|nr:M42 family peptidase [Solirubrobacterales bacterium]